MWYQTTASQKKHHRDASPRSSPFVVDVLFDLDLKITAEQLHISSVWELFQLVRISRSELLKNYSRGRSSSARNTR